MPTYGVYSDDLVPRIAPASIAHPAGGTLGFYGVTPATQRAAALQSGSGISAASASYGATQAAWAVEVTAVLTALGLWKGGA